MAQVKGGRSKPTAEPEDGPPRVDMVRIEGKSEGYCLAMSELEPETRHAVLGVNAGTCLFGASRGKFPHHVETLKDASVAVAGGDLSLLSRTLTAQALSLDNLFTQMVLKAAANMGEYPEAHERYMRLAFKAQAQSRATVEALMKLHQPREQTVNHRHYYIAADGQAVFVENHHGGAGNGRFGNQPHAAAATGSLAALPGSDPFGFGVPIPGHAERPMPDARWQVAGRSEGESQCMEARGAIGGNDRVGPGASQDGAGAV